MDLDELLFEKVARYFKRRKNAAKAGESMVLLEDIRSRALIMSRALSGFPIEIFPAEREGGYKNNNYFLPPSMNIFPTNAENLAYYFFRIAYLSVQQELGLNWEQKSGGTTEVARTKAVQASEIIMNKIRAEYPAVAVLHDRFLEHLTRLAQIDKKDPDLTWLYGKYMVNDRQSDDPDKLHHIGDSLKSGIKPEPKTTIKAKAVEEINSVQVDKKQQEDYVLTHNFEKVETAEEFDGVWRDFDGDDDLKKHQEAIDELNMKLTVRVDEMTHSVYQADFIENASVSESTDKTREGHFFTYPEWEYSARKYRENFCKVFPETQSAVNAQYYHDTVHTNSTILNSLRKMLASSSNKMTMKRRLTEGYDFDTDALTDFWCDVHSNHTPSDKLYLADRRQEKDFALTLLLDTSLSSDGYAAGNRVIDIEKQVSILFGEILNEFDIDFSVASFFSKTRNYLCYNSLKEFDESWNQAKYRIGATEPAGYTRIGAALRHAGNVLNNRPAKYRWVVLLSDGKPNDYDKYEGRYGIHDVKQALRELNRDRISTYALAIEAQARYYLPQMFGPNQYQILSSTDELLRALVLLFEKFSHQR